MGVDGDGGVVPSRGDACCFGSFVLGSTGVGRLVEVPVKKKLSGFGNLGTVGLGVGGRVAGCSMKRAMGRASS